jgi:quinol monooxygenase YgiN
MYGTVARLKIKPGMDVELAAFGTNWTKGRKAQVKGAIGGYIYRLDNDPQTVIMAVVFADKASYHANAQDPAQDVEYRRLRAMLAEDPIWEDGEIIATL